MTPSERRLMEPGPLMAAARVLIGAVRRLDRTFHFV